MKAQPATLYAVPHSLYAGRARSYLIKRGVTYRECAPKTEHFLKTVLPLAGGRLGMPTIELTDGRVIRDGAAIIDHFEAESGHAFSPATPKQQLVSRLFDVIGAEGLLRPAMHYRWNFDAENLAFLEFHMGMMTPPGEGGRKMARGIIEAMRQATSQFGVTSENGRLVEDVYADQLGALDRHFESHAYLLGGRPCIGDFGMIAPLFGHLGRDPKPLALMQTKSPRVFRWVERMNRREADLLGMDRQEESYLGADEIPETLIEVLAALAEDFVPETLAAAEAINAWLGRQDELAPGTECARGAGHAEFELRGKTIRALAQPYRFYLLKRVQDAYAALDAGARAAVDDVLERSGMAPVLDARIDREIGRQGNLEVWL